MSLVAGIDVGAARKASHVALLDAAWRLAEPVVVERDVSRAARRLAELGVSVAAIDAPRGPALDGARSRACERALRAGTGHGIFWTPSSAAIDGHYLQGWLEAGFAWYAALDAIGITTVEAFPSAAFAALDARRAGEARAAHTTRVGAVVRAAVGDDEHALRSQDDRDALCAAWIARAVLDGTATWFDGEGRDTDRIAIVRSVAATNQGRPPTDR